MDDRPSFCPRCRYDRSGAPDRECPECGETRPGLEYLPARTPPTLQLIIVMALFLLPILPITLLGVLASLLAL